MHIKRLRPQSVAKLVASVGYRIGYAYLKKRDGSWRSMWFHSLIPQRLLAGGELPYNKTEKRISIVRDIMKEENDCIRAIRWDAVKILSVNGTTYIRKEI